MDWPTVWSGPPYPGKGLDMWCAQFNWVPTSFERVLQVRTDSGGTFTLNNLAGSWAPVTHVSHWVWGAGAETADDNPAVLAAAARTWPVYLAAACAVLGEPTWEGAWDADDFPENLGSHDVGSRDFRLTHKDPHRLAYWLGTESTSPMIVMEISLAAGTAQDLFDGAANLSLKFYPHPVEIGDL
ncbi:hypothetical protein [Streptomyces sp. 3214.6]|uniref:hypothetical protein n=1 Tax=Streptomyces sp. 3214.6 TaxID=1882757 RepID=UPI00135210B1|nr:hypothetical protein [Streptomyces sp. 3214.6]